ncbi:MAG TPA: DNA recombination protein RmuC [Salinimicrobium sp.]|nr:DNA recombination protein RmuC [Salinimicrobium sp.]
MNETLIIGSLFLFFILGIIIGTVVAVYRNKAGQSTLSERNSQLSMQLENLKGQLEQQIAHLKEQSESARIGAQKQFEETCAEREKIRDEKDDLRERLTRKESEFNNLLQKYEDQHQEIEKLNEKFIKEFENLAHKILEKNSSTFTLQNKENMKNILDPLQEKIRTFEEKVDKNSNEFTKRHAELGTQLKHLNEQNLKISVEATNLTKALKGSTKLQGNWGEMVLERVLERSGLMKDSEYFVQQNFTNEDGKRVMPDVVIHLPGDKKMIVDSKVSLVAYERFINEEEPEERKIHLRNHLISVKKRVEELSRKNYHTLYQMESPDFVLLFIPIEAAFAIASNEYPNLYSDAFDKNVIIVTPTTLLAVLKTIDSMWQNEKQKQNAIDIATQAGALYDSFSNLTEELLKVGRQIGTVQNSYEGAMKKLTGKGNLITRVERLKKLGAKASKQIDPKLLVRASGHDEDQENEENEN